MWASVGEQMVGSWPTTVPVQEIVKLQKHSNLQTHISRASRWLTEWLTGIAWVPSVRVSDGSSGPEIRGKRLARPEGLEPPTF